MRAWNRPAVGLGPLLVLEVAGQVGGGVGEDGDADPGGQQGVEGAEAVEPEGQPGVPGRQPGDVEPATAGEPRPSTATNATTADTAASPAAWEDCPAARSGIFTHPASL